VLPLQSSLLEVRANSVLSDVTPAPFLAEIVDPMTARVATVSGLAAGMLDVIFQPALIGPFCKVFHGIVLAVTDCSPEKRLMGLRLSFHRETQ
jgi:hypothetical protein